MIKERSADQVEDYKKRAKQLIKHVFGRNPKQLNYKTGGQTNFVFEALTKEGAFIVRLSTAAEKIDDFKKEQWIIDKVRGVGIPVADIIEIGNDVTKYPYMIQKKVEGTEALYHHDKKKVLHQMGEFTAHIHTIKTNGFGKCFDWSGDDHLKNTTWREYIDKELKLEQRLKVFSQHKILSRKNINKLKSTLIELPGNKPQPRLNHGDLRRKNVIVNDKGDITAIIDWGEGCSNIAPVWDLSIALHDLSVDDKQYFLEGYGISAKQYAAIADSIKALNILNYAHSIEEIVKSKNRKLLEFYRLRLGGHFDLYSL
jgi:aminoglycoside phosphotransferase (APT) family kinase protein